MKEKINLFMKELNKITDFNRVKFVILFGSYSKGKETKLSDIDLAIYYEGNKAERYNFRKKMMGILPDSLDVQIFQDLPLYIQIEILKGKIIYFSDEKLLYNIFYNTIKTFDEFKKGYYDYLNRRHIIC